MLRGGTRPDCFSFGWSGSAATGCYSCMHDDAVRTSRGHGQANRGRAAAMTLSPLANSLIAVGDVMLGDSAVCVGYGFHSAYGHDATTAFATAADRLRRGEIVFGNLECVLTSRGQGPTRLQTDQMRGDPAYARALRNVGFTVMSVANNHAMQHGRDAFNETVDHLQGAGIACAGLRGDDGWCAKPTVVVTRDGLRVGVLAYCWRPRQYDAMSPPYAEGEWDAVARDVRRLRNEADAV